MNHNFYIAALALVWLGILLTIFFFPRDTDQVKPRGSIADEFSDRNAWRQGWWGDLLFRLRLFLRRQVVVDVLNKVEGALEVIAMLRKGDILTPARMQLLVGAQVDLAAAQAELRALLFGLTPPAPQRFDGPEECAVVIDRGNTSEIIVRPDGTLVDGQGRPLPKTAIIGYGDPL